MPKFREEADPEALAIAALGYLAGDTERLGRFLAVTGLSPERLRQAAAEPGFLPGILDHLLADEALLLAFAANRGIDPAAIVRARERMGRTSA